MPVTSTNTTTFSKQLSAPHQTVTDTPLSPTTTTQEDLTTASQRRVNLIWEATQAVIASVIVGANVYVAVYMAASRIPFTDYPPILSHSMFLIVGFYFSRTNHAAIGGIGAKPPMQRYEGR